MIKKINWYISIPYHFPDSQLFLLQVTRNCLLVKNFDLERKYGIILYKKTDAIQHLAASTIQRSHNTHKFGNHSDHATCERGRKPSHVLFLLCLYKKIKKLPNKSILLLSQALNSFIYQRDTVRIIIQTLISTCWRSWDEF